MAQTSFVVLGGGTDGGGIQIYHDGTGWHIKRIPPWNPEQMLELSAAIKVTALAGGIKQAEASQTIIDAAARLVDSEIGHVVGKEAGRVIVVVAGP